ncbi:MAG TPA: amidohydrolase family protein [Armatimonadota bacterium]|nr:amidohydrolase family protein [Armatimonadota bacterium]
MRFVVAAALLILAPIGWADDAPEEPKPQRIVAIEGGTVLTMTGAPVENGTVVITDGKITAVGVGVEVPDGAERIDATGKTVMPGLIDAFSRLYIYPQDLSEGSAIAADLRVIDGIDPYSDDGEEVIQHGVTSVHVLPGSRGLIAGLSAVVKVGAGDGSVEVVSDAVATRGQIGIPSGSSTSSLAKLGNYTSIREALLGARDYQFGWEKYERQLSEYDRKTSPPDEEDGDEEEDAEGEDVEEDEDADEKPGGDEKKPKEKKPDAEKPDRPKKPGIDHGKDVLVRALKREIPLLIEAHRVPDILNALRLDDEFDIDLVLLGCSEGHRIAAEITRREVPVIVGPVSLSVARPSRIRYGDHSRANAAILAEAGVTVALGVGGEVALHSKLTRASAAIAVANGLSRQAALEAITIRPAEVLGVADRVGSLAEGRDADILILSGDPLDVRSPVDAVLVGGEVVFEREADG